MFTNFTLFTSSDVSYFLEVFSALEQAGLTLATSSAVSVFSTTVVATGISENRKKKNKAF